MSFYGLVGFFINPDVNCYHILLSVLIAADERDEPETSMDASSTQLRRAPNQFFLVRLILSKTKQKNH